MSVRVCKLTNGTAARESLGQNVVTGQLVRESREIGRAGKQLRAVVYADTVECHERIAECTEFRVDPLCFLKYRSALAFLRDHRVDSCEFLERLGTVQRPGIHLTAHHGEREAVVFVEIDRLIIEPKRHLIFVGYLAQQSEIAPEQGGVQLIVVVVARQAERIVIEGEHRRIDHLGVIVEIFREQPVLPRVFRVVARDRHGKRELAGSRLFVQIRLPSCLRELIGVEWLVPDVYADRAFPGSKRIRKRHHRLELALAGYKFLHTAVEREILEKQVDAVFLAELHRFKCLLMGRPAKL